MCWVQNRTRQRYDTSYGAVQFQQPAYHGIKVPDAVAVQVVDDDLHVPVRVGPQMLEAELGAEDQVVQLDTDRRRH